MLTLDAAYVRAALPRRDRYAHRGKLPAVYAAHGVGRAHKQRDVAVFQRPFAHAHP